jgi:hypothetical protein
MTKSRMVSSNMRKTSMRVKRKKTWKEKRASGIDLNSNVVPDYGLKKPVGNRKARGTGDVTKAYLTSRNTPRIRKRPSGGSSVGSSKRGRYSSSKRTEYRSSNSHRE